MWGWVGWNRPPEDKEGPLCGSVWTLERLKMYVRALMKVCFPTVFTPPGPSAYLTLNTRVMETRRVRPEFIFCLFVLLLIRNSGFNVCDLCDCTLMQSVLMDADRKIKLEEKLEFAHIIKLYKNTHTRTSQNALRQEQCWLCATALLHFRTVNVCLLYDGTQREKRNSCRCLFELWPNPTSSGGVGAPSAPNPSRSCTPSQPDTCAHTHTRTVHPQIFEHHSPSHTHTQVPVHLSHIKVCLCFHHFRSSQGRYFPLFPTHTHTPSGGGVCVSQLPEALALITCSSEPFGLTL